MHSLVNNSYCTQSWGPEVFQIQRTHTSNGQEKAHCIWVCKTEHEPDNYIFPCKLCAMSLEYN